MTKTCTRHLGTALRRGAPGIRSIVTPKYKKICYLFMKSSTEVSSVSCRTASDTDHNCPSLPSTTTANIYRGRLCLVDVPRLQMESGQIAPTSPSAPSHSAWSSAPWGLLRNPREPSNLLPLMGSGPARPDRPRQNNNNNNNDHNQLKMALPQLSHARCIQSYEVISTTSSACA